MATLGDILPRKTVSEIQESIIEPGSIFIGPMEGVDHDKFYIIAGVSGDKYCICSVVINSRINQFIQKRPRLLARQVLILKENYTFLDHDSYINCANPLKGESEKFKENSFEFRDSLIPSDLKKVIDNIKASGALSQDEIELFFNETAK